jgi:hypothetical protein
MIKSLFNKLTNDVAKRITDLARQINDEVKRIIHPNKSPDVHTIQDVLRGFDNPFLSLMSESMTDVSVEPFTPEQMRHYKVGDVELSDRLYQQSRETAARVRKIVVDRAQYGHDAQKLALDLYEGYGFRDNEALVPKVRLPKYMNDALLNRDMDALMARIQAAKLKTAPLRAAYLQALDRVIKGKGTAAIDKALDVAVQERYRYFANRIARTELARLQNAQIARDMMADDAVQVVQLRLSAKHPKPDICDMYSKQDAYGLGQGCYPKGKAPLPPFHPHCYCFLRERPDLSVKHAKHKPDAAAKLLSGLSPREAARIVGSQEKLLRLLSGEQFDVLINAGRPNGYQIKSVDDA